LDPRQRLAQPRCLAREVGSREPFPRTLHREPELVQQPRHVMIVVADAEPLLDQVADHRPGPDARLVARLDRPELDDHNLRDPV